jgi:hypothetical protein
MNTSLRLLTMVCPALAWVALLAAQPAIAQVEKPSEEDLAGVQPAFQNLVRGRSTKIDQGANGRAAARAGGPPAPQAPPPKNPSTSLRDLRGQWGAGGFGAGAPPAPAAAPAAAPAGGAAPGAAPQPSPASGNQGNYVNALAGKVVNTQFDANRMCLYTPAFLFNGGKFYQTERELIIVNSNELRVRRVHLNAQHAASPVPSYNGDAVGRWEGNTLVVDTIALKGSLGKIGGNVEDGYHTLLLANPTLHVIERFSRNVDGSELTIERVIDDPMGDKPVFRNKTTLRYAADTFNNETESGCEDFGDAFGPAYVGEKGQQP